MSILSVTNLQKKFGDLTVLKDISFQISDGEIVSIIGWNTRLQRERCSKRDFNGNWICISEFQSVSSLQCIKERNGSACLCGRGGKRRGQEKGNGTA